MNAATNTMNDELLDRMRWETDVLADTTVSNILGPWHSLPHPATLDATIQANASAWERVAVVNRLFGKWQDNGSLPDWKAEGRNLPADITALLETYVRTGCRLPDWVEPRKVARAEELFLDHGVLSCVLLFCSSLPECYVIPDLSAVLQATGQLQRHTDYRIRATAAMVFPVMMPGGLTAPQGEGIAQILKVRLIHATVRNLILRGDPARVERTQNVTALADLPDGADMSQTLLAMAWDMEHNCMPCNQEELAYTLLTFSYVFLRSLRRLGLALPRADEEAYLHAWNVVGHVLGIRRELMVHTMDDAARLFTHLQVRGRARQVEPDARPALTRALMQTMQNVLPLRVLKPFPALLTRHLCGKATARDLGLTRATPWVSRFLFALCMGIVRVIDTVIRLFSPRFCISRLITRLLGQRFMAQLLMEQVRPLQMPQVLPEPKQLPASLRQRVKDMVQRWKRKGPRK